MSPFRSCAKTVYREQRGLPVIDSLAQDVRLALRLLQREHRFALTVVLVLGIGIGVNNMMFTLIYAHTIRGLPIPRADRVLDIATSGDDGAPRPMSFADFADMRGVARSFSGMSAFSSSPVVVSENARAPERFLGSYASANSLDVLGIQPALGRGFVGDDDRRGAAAVAVLGEAIWRSHYASDRDILGRLILVNGMPTTIVGVMAPASGFPSTAEVLLPLTQMPGIWQAGRDARTLRVFGRLRDEVQPDDAVAEIARISQELRDSYPETNARARPRVVPINQRHLGRFTDPAWLSFIGVGFVVVLISCANAANLMLARAARRAREIAVRSSLGATRARVVVQLLTESVVLATLAGVAGLAVSVAGVRMLRSSIPPSAFPYWWAWEMDGRVFGALVAVSFGTVLVFGLLPAWQGAKTNAADVLKSAGRALIPSHRSGKIASALVAAEIALSAVLVSYVVISFRTAPSALRSDRTIDTNEILTATVTLPSAGYASERERAAFYRRLAERVQIVSGVTAFATASHLPLRTPAEQRLEIADRARVDGNELPAVWSLSISTNYFAALGLPVIRGRELVDEDGAPGAPAAIVNERLAELFFSGEDPVGKRIRLTSVGANTTPPWLTIVGVAATVRQRSGANIDPIVYVPIGRAPPVTTALLVRSAAPTALITSQLREQIRLVDPNLPLYNVATMAEALYQEEWLGRFSANLIRLLAFIALTLTVFGLYAVTAHV